MPSTLNRARPLSGLRLANRPLLDLPIREDHHQRVPRAQDAHLDPGSRRAAGSWADGPLHGNDLASRPSPMTKETAARTTGHQRRGGRAMTALRTARTLRPSRSNSPTTAPPIAPVAPNTTCREWSGSGITTPPGRDPQVLQQPNHLHTSTRPRIHDVPALVFSCGKGTSLGVLAGRIRCLLSLDAQSPQSPRFSRQVPGLAGEHRCPGLRGPLRAACAESAYVHGSDSHVDPASPGRRSESARAAQPGHEG